MVVARRRNGLGRVVRVMLLGAITAFGLVPVLAQVAAAGTQGSSCSSDPSRVRLWENAQGETGDNDDSLWQCTNQTNLGDVDHTLVGGCKTSGGSNGTWNDCVSSITFWVEEGYKICLYEDANYSGVVDFRYGPLAGDRFDVGVGWNDKLSSFRWRGAGNPC